MRHALPAALAALGLIIAAWIFGSAYVEAREVANGGAQSLSVKGYAERPVSSDKGSWTGQFETYDTQLRSAYAALERDRNKVRNFLAGAGFPDARFGTVSTQEVYEQLANGYQSSRILGYRLTQNVSLESSDLDRLETLVQTSGELISDGVNFQSYEPQYFVSEIEALKVEILGQAAANAYARAEQLATNTGSEVGELTYASQGVFQITGPNSAEVENYGIFDTRTREKVIKAVVTVSFRIDD